MKPSFPATSLKYKGLDVIIFLQYVDFTGTSHNNGLKFYVLITPREKIEIPSIQLFNDINLNRWLAEVILYKIFFYQKIWNCETSYKRIHVSFLKFSYKLLKNY